MLPRMLRLMHMHLKRWSAYVSLVFSSCRRGTALHEVRDCTSAHVSRKEASMDT